MMSLPSRRARSRVRGDLSSAAARRPSLRHRAFLGAIRRPSRLVGTDEHDGSGRSHSVAAWTEEHAELHTGPVIVAALGLRRSEDEERPYLARMLGATSWKQRAAADRERVAAGVSRTGTAPVGALRGARLTGNEDHAGGLDRALRPQPSAPARAPTRRSTPRRGGRGRRPTPAHGARACQRVGDSRLGVHDDVRDAGHRLADAARDGARLGLGRGEGRVRLEPERDGTETVARRERCAAPVGARPVTSTTARSTSAGSWASRRPGAVSARGSMCLDGALPPGRLDGSRVRRPLRSHSACIGRSWPGSLRWSAASMPSSVSISFRLWISRTCATAIAAARTRSRSSPSARLGSTWTTMSLCGSTRCTASSTRSPAACP